MAPKSASEFSAEGICFVCGKETASHRFARLHEAPGKDFCSPRCLILYHDVPCPQAERNGRAGYYSAQKMALEEASSLLSQILQSPAFLPIYLGNMRLAFSYIRFSSLQQKKGDSKRRQLAKTERWAQEHGLVLDKGLSMVDEGRSAYKGHHRTQGALGRFLAAVKDGRIPKGSVLIVEAMDRLTREEVPAALEMFLGILRAGVEVVTMIDNQWYTQESLNRDVSQLIISISAMWRAHEEVALRADRLAEVWAEKRRRALADKVPMTSICPGWLKRAQGQGAYEPIPERIRIVKLVFWLKLRGWGYQRIARLFNRHLQKVPTWGVGGKRADAWHSSYIQKILRNRAVLGEVELFSTREGRRKPIPGGVIRGFFPRIIDESTFLRAQDRRPGPRCPVGRSVSNLFQNLIKDGEHPDCSMCYRDHGDAGGKWIYLVSDHRRKHPDAPSFSWQYPALERLILNYLVDMDWSSLAAARIAEVRQLRQELEEKEARVAEVGRQVKRLLELVKRAGDIEETARELGELEQQRGALRAEVKGLKAAIAEKGEFGADEAAQLIRRLAADRTSPASRLRLREVIRSQVERVDIFRSIPTRILKGFEMGACRPRVRGLVRGRCVRVLFRAGAERWIIERETDPGFGVRFEGPQPPPPTFLTVENDDRGGKVLVDMRENRRPAPVLKNRWLARKAAESAGKAPASPRQT